MAELAEAGAERSAKKMAKETADQAAEAAAKQGAEAAATVATKELPSSLATRFKQLVKESNATNKIVNMSIKDADGIHTAFKKLELDEGASTVQETYLLQQLFKKTKPAEMGDFIKVLKKFKNDVKINDMLSGISDTTAQKQIREALTSRSDKMLAWMKKNPKYTAVGLTGLSFASMILYAAVVEGKTIAEATEEVAKKLGATAKDIAEINGEILAAGIKGGVGGLFGDLPEAVKKILIIIIVVFGGLFVIFLGGRYFKWW